MMENKKNKVICVLGMHRSGTSMLMRLLNICGVCIGEKEELLAADTGSNERGHWENLEILSINEEILEIFGGSWDDPPVFPENWQNDKRLDGLCKRAEKFVQDMNSRAQVWGFKEPRTCLTLPFWKKIIPNMVYIIPVRDATEVAMSLQKRDGSTLRKGLFLWSQYWKNILDNTAGERRFFTLNRNYFVDWKRELENIIEFIGDDAVNFVGKEDALNDFILPALRHNSDKRVNSFGKTKDINDTLILQKAFEAELIFNLGEIYKDGEREVDENKKVAQQKDQELQQKDQELQEKREEIQHKDQDLQQKELIIQQKDYELCEKNQLLTEKEKQFSAVINSLQWRIPNYLLNNTVTFYRKIKNAAIEKRDAKKRIRDIIYFSKKNNKIDFSIANEKLSVVMLTLDRLNDTKKSIKALYKNITFPFEFIILDNGSDDRMIKYLERLKKNKDNVKVIFEKENLGCAGGRKKAFAMTTGDYILSIDNDIFLMPFAIHNLIQTLRDNPRSAGACCKSVFPNGEIQFNGGSMKVDDKFVKFKLVDGEKKFNDPATFVQTQSDWIPGGATVWKKEVLNKYEIDDEMKGSYEDNAFSLVLKKAGYELYNCPNAIAIHNHIYFNPGARKEKRYMQNRYDERRTLHAVLRFYKEHGLIIEDPFLSQIGFNIGEKDKILNFFESN